MMRTLVALSLGLAAGVFGFTTGAGLTGSRLAATVIAAFAAGLVALLVCRLPPWITRPWPGIVPGSFTMLVLEP